MTPEEIVAAAVAKLGVPYELIPIDPAFGHTQIQKKEHLSLGACIHPDAGYPPF